MEQDGFPLDVVICYYVKTWPKEAESWFTRQTHWPDRELKSRIRKTGHLLVPTGKRKSEESDLEWRCSLSIAEKILFRSMTNFQICTFLMLKALVKEYLPKHINTDGEKQLLSTYHIKTVFLWSLEDNTVKWEPEHMLGNLGYMFDKLLSLINEQDFPHYFIPSINLLDDERLHGRQKPLISSLSAIRDDLSNKVRKSQFFVGQTIAKISLHTLTDSFFFRDMYNQVMLTVMGRVQVSMYTPLSVILIQLNYSLLIDSLISEKPSLNPHALHLYRAMYTDPIPDKLLMETVPGLIDQYRGCLHLAKYCMAARDGRVLPGVLHTAELLLRDTLHLDPCTGHVKLACFYMATGNFVLAVDSLHTAENHFLLVHKNLMTSALRHLPTVYTGIINEVFQKWVEGQAGCDIVVTWPEYTTVPDLLQFELIYERTHPSEFEKVWLERYLHFPPLSLIKLLKFVCDRYSGRSSTNHMEDLVSDLIASSLYIPVYIVPSENDIHTVFNMAAWCYIKIKKYKPAIRMMTVAIVSRPQTEIMKRCAFSHHFSAYVIAQCLATASRCAFRPQQLKL